MLIPTVTPARDLNAGPQRPDSTLVAGPRIVMSFFLPTLPFISLLISSGPSDRYFMYLLAIFFLGNAANMILMALQLGIVCVDSGIRIAAPLVTGY
jgi:hypothetical protein